MRRNLVERIAALESLGKTDALAAADEAARRERAGSAVAALIEQLEREKTEYAALDASGRIRHWLGKIEAARTYLADYADQPPPMFGDRPVTQLMERLRDDFWKDDLNEARENLRGGEYWFELTAARLDRLTELGYDRSRLEEWDVIRRKWQPMPWKWMPEYVGLPKDALRMLDSEMPTKPNS